MKIYPIIKRLMDLLIALTVLTFGLPFFILLALLIFVDSKGSPFYAQKRVGHNQKPFTMYKFRTMIKDADKMKEQYAHLNQAVFPTFKIINDPRLTRAGRFLRDTHMDELPNFVNVLKGNMSIIGFRPPTPDEVEHYKEWHMQRFEGKPGITSLWVTYGYHEFTFDNWITSDIIYHHNKSLKLDLKIMYKTIRKIMR